MPLRSVTMPYFAYSGIIGAFHFYLEKREQQKKAKSKNKEKKVRSHATMHLSRSLATPAQPRSARAASASILFAAHILRSCFTASRDFGPLLVLLYATRSGEEKGIRFHHTLRASRHCVSIARLIRRRQATARQQTFYTNEARPIACDFIHNMVNIWKERIITKGHIERDT